MCDGYGFFQWQTQVEEDHSETEQLARTSQIRDAYKILTRGFQSYFVLHLDQYIKEWKSSLANASFSL
jgi:hypothetical protein